MGTYVPMAMTNSRDDAGDYFACNDEQKQQNPNDIAESVSLIGCRYASFSRSVSC